VEYDYDRYGNLSRESGDPESKDAYTARGNVYKKLAKLSGDANRKNEYLEKAERDFKSAAEMSTN
jgi:hypothetical protein